MVWRNGLYVCGWCAGVVMATPDNGLRCLSCGRDVVMTTMAEHRRVVAEHREMDALRQADAPREAFRRGRPPRTNCPPNGGYRDQSLREIMARLKTFNSLQIADEIGTVRESTTEGYCRLYERRGLIRRTNDPIRWKGERLIYAWVGDAVEDAVESVAS